MSTPAQIQANQLNAQHSSGPRTPEGKATVSRNATRHGLTATYPVIRSLEEQSQFDALEAAFQYELRPYTPTELTLFKQLVLAAWNIDRCHRLESELAATTEIDPLLDETASKTLARIDSYRARAERLFHRNLKQLKAIPSTRPAPQIKPNPERAPERKVLFLEEKLGRNDPCPCQSGKKFKFCCIDKVTIQRPSSRLI